MTIRLKLNLLVTSLIAIFIVAVGFMLHAVYEVNQRTSDYSRMRTMSEATADIRTALYQNLVTHNGIVDDPPEMAVTAWPRDVLDHIDIQVRLAQTPEEAASWQRIRALIVGLPALNVTGSDSVRLQETIQLIDHELGTLRRAYDAAEYDLIKAIAQYQLKSQVAIWIACALTVLLFLIYLIMVGHWLMNPIAMLKSRADAIGEGRLDERVDLKGKDELAELARHMNAMSQSLLKQQAALLEARELSAIGEVCGHVAHGLRNPLAIMRSSAQLALQRMSESVPIEATLEDLVQQADRMDQRITQMFEFSKPLALTSSPTSFAELARDAKREAEPLLEAKNISLQIEDDTGPSTWLVDRQHLAGVIEELVINAAYHSPEGGEIKLIGSILPPDNGSADRLRIEVIDRGCGMSPATAHKVFDMFFTKRLDGTGLGLPLARRIVRKHDGDIQVQSQEGEGTTAVITIPRRTSQAGAAEKS